MVVKAKAMELQGWTSRGMPGLSWCPDHKGTKARRKLGPTITVCMGGFGDSAAWTEFFGPVEGVWYVESKQRLGNADQNGSLGAKPKSRLSVSSRGVPACAALGA